MPPDSITLYPTGTAHAIARQMRKVWPGRALYWVSNDGGKFGFNFRSRAKAADRAALELSDGWPCRVVVSPKP